MRALAAVALALALWAAAASQAPAASPGTRCATIVVKTKTGFERASALTVDGASCRTAHAVARGALRHDEGAPYRVAGFTCDLVSDRQLGCDRGKVSIQFDVGEASAAPATCPRATLFRSGGRRALATSIQRSPKVGCGKAVQLLRAAFGRERTPPGWRCRHGASGAACWSTRRRSLNVLPSISGGHRLAVTADAP